VVRERLPNSMYRVEIEGGRKLTGHLAGDARALLTRLMNGDHVTVELEDEGGDTCRIVGRPAGAKGR
jgi:translation initiation factor IF-1